MTNETKKQIIEAVIAGNVPLLMALQKQAKEHAFLDQYLDENGKGSVPVEVWIAPKS